MLGDPSLQPPVDMFPAPSPFLSAAGVGPRRTEPGASSEADAPGRARAFGRPALHPRRPAIGILPGSVLVVCRALHSGRFEIVPSLRSFGDFREGCDSAARREAEFREALMLAATVPVAPRRGRFLL